MVLGTLRISRGGMTLQQNAFRQWLIEISNFARITSINFRLNWLTVQTKRLERNSMHCACFNVLNKLRKSSARFGTLSDPSEAVKRYSLEGRIPLDLALSLEQQTSLPSQVCPHDKRTTQILQHFCQDKTLFHRGMDHHAWSVNVRNRYFTVLSAAFPTGS